MPAKASIPRPYIRLPEQTQAEPTYTRKDSPVPGSLLQRLEDGLQEWGLESHVVITHQGHRYLSLTKLASDVGISLSHLSRILTHQRHPSLVVAIRLSQAMGITLDALAQRLGLLPTPTPTTQ